MRTRLTLVAAPVAAVLVLGACTGSVTAQPEAARSSHLIAAGDAPDERDQADQRAVEVLRELTVRGSATDAPDPDDVWWWLDSPPSADAAVTVTDARAELHEGFDRVVLHLAGTGTPGWVTEVVEVATDDGSGFPVELAGDRFVLLRLAGVAFPPSAETAHIEPQVLDVGGARLAEVAVRYWFEGNVNIFLGTVGTDDPVVEVSLDQDPLRLVVDVAHS